MAECIQPNALWVKCYVCEKLIKTCNGIDDICPIHPKGYESNGHWFCSGECEDIAASSSSFFVMDSANY